IYLAAAIMDPKSLILNNPPSDIAHSRPPYEIPSVYIVGPQCTGKTTLVEGLAAHFALHPSPTIPPPTIIDEVARHVIRKYQFPPNDIRDAPTKSLELQQHIQKTQMQVEQRTRMSGSSWFISDRSGIDPIVYATMYAPEGGAAQLMESDIWKFLRGRMVKALVIMCEPGMDWLDDDGERLMPLDMDEWMEMSSHFCLLLEKSGINYVVLPSRVTGMQERIDFVLDKWKNIKSKRAMI
ncbi:MAG: hypothetical protein M1834_001003, partial [Cirrosporium novae-zelandiae]